MGASSIQTTGAPSMLETGSTHLNLKDIEARMRVKLQWYTAH